MLPTKSAHLPMAPCCWRATATCDGKKSLATINQEEGTWEVVNQQLRDFGNGFEASSTYRVPLERLERLTEACRDVASHLETSHIYEPFVRGSKGRSEGVQEDFEGRYAATGQDLTDSVLTLAGFAEEAHSAVRRILAVLKSLTRRPPTRSARLRLGR
jgi:hypothetical protein